MIIGLSGAIGSGKSHTQLKVALEYCERKQKQLVCNFRVNVRAVYRYAKLKKYRWVQRLCMRGGIIQIVSPAKLEALLIPESVVCLDEAGIFLNAREFATTSRQLLADLAQSRKDGVDLVWAAQFNEQVDRQFRMLTQYWVHCDGLAIFDKKTKRPRLIWKRIYWFTAWDYNFWVNDPKCRSSHWKTRLQYSFQYEGGTLNRADYALFDCFDSFSRLDASEQYSYIRTLQRCDLPANYYFNAGPPLDLSPSPPAPSPSSVPLGGRTNLIRAALQVAREKKLKAPFFKSLTDDQIETFIRSHS